MMIFILQGKKKRKIDAVSSYLRETFHYAQVYKGKYVHLAKEPEEPFS